MGVTLLAGSVTGTVCSSCVEQMLQPAQPSGSGSLATWVGAGSIKPCPAECVWVGVLVLY
jgi:hypothetical protein